jgi:hypothetical protein
MWNKVLWFGGDEVGWGESEKVQVDGGGGEGRVHFASFAQSTKLLITHSLSAVFCSFLGTHSLHFSLASTHLSLFFHCSVTSPFLVHFKCPSQTHFTTELLSRTKEFGAYFHKYKCMNILSITVPSFIFSVLQHSGKGSSI